MAEELSFVTPFNADEAPSMENFNRRIREVNALAEQLGGARGGGPYYATCAAAGSTTAKVAACEGFTLKTGAAALVKFTNANTAASPTLNVNGTGAKSIKKYGTTGSMAYMWTSGAVLLLVYDGTNWIMENGSIASTSYYGVTKLNNSTGSPSTTEAATANAVRMVNLTAAEALELAKRGSSADQMKLSEAAKAALSVTDTVEAGLPGDFSGALIATFDSRPGPGTLSCPLQFHRADGYYNARMSSWTIQPTMEQSLLRSGLQLQIPEAVQEQLRRADDAALLSFRRTGESYSSVVKWNGIDSCPVSLQKTYDALFDISLTLYVLGYKEEVVFAPETVEDALMRTVPGPLTVPPPTQEGHAANKEYVDAKIRDMVEANLDRFARIIITDLTAGASREINVPLTNWNAGTSVYNALLSYTGTIPFGGELRIRLVPPPYYAFNGLSGSSFPYLVIESTAWPGNLDAKGVYTFDVGTTGAGASFKFVRNYYDPYSRRDSVAITLEVA